MIQEDKISIKAINILQCYFKEWNSYQITISAVIQHKAVKQHYHITAVC